MRHYINNSILNRCIIVFVLLGLFITVSAFSYSTSVLGHISESVFRLHVLANSDSAEDQELKYQVRDRIIEYMESISQNANTKEDVIKIANNNLETLKEVANQVISENGYDYRCICRNWELLFSYKKLW